MENFMVLLNHQCYEIPTQKKVESFEVYQKKAIPKNLIIYHEHEYYELYFLLKGSLKFYADGREFVLNENDIFILDSGILHQQLIEDYSQLERVIIWVNKDYFINNFIDSPYYFSLTKIVENFTNIHLDHNKYNNQYVFLSLLKLVNNINKGEYSQSEELFNELLMSLLKVMNVNNISNTEKTKLKDEKIANIITYINKNINTDISIDSLAVKFYMSKFYLMRKFNEEVGCSIHRYLTEQRISMAKRLLCDGHSIDKVYFEVGYKDYSTFFKAFKKIVGISPGKFRDDVLLKE